MSAIVQTTQGLVSGFEIEGTTAFLSLPYGAPTGGAARWLAPQPPIPWAGVLDTVAYGQM